MKRTLLAAALLFALPAAAQIGPVDSYDDGDWWLLAPPTGTLIMLANGTGKRTGDVVELEIFGFFLEPQDGGVLGLRALSPVNCVEKTGDLINQTIFFTNRAPLEESGTGAGMMAFTKRSPAYDLACTTNRDGMRHFTNRSRNAVVAEIRAGLK